MYIDKKQIVVSLLEIIHHLSDKDYQKKAWIQGEAADFDESACLFFDIGDPIIENNKDYGITQNQHQILMQFHETFEDFSDKHYWPPEFIDTPEWAKIMDMAKEVLKVFHYS